MSFGRRITLAAAGAVAVAVLMASVVAYVVMRGELRGQVDDSLQDRAQVLAELNRLPGGGPPSGLPPPAALLGGAAGYVQLVSADGGTSRPGGGRIALPVNDETQRLASEGGEELLADAHVGRSHVRILAVPLDGGGAVQIARPLDEVDGVLRRMRAILAGVLALGVLLAVALGGFVTRTALGPIERLTEASEHVAATRDLSRRIEPGKRDELGRLATSFNTMLDALEQSVDALDASVIAQRQLVADASHELRTPITSLRTNIDVLRAPEQLSGPQRERLLDELSSQLDELTVLMSDLIQLARGDEPLQQTEDVRLDLLTAEAIERAGRHAPGVRFESELQPTVVEGVPERLERAVFNLLHNATKWTSPGGVVEVAVGNGEVAVRDHGPGISDQDLPHLFDRFYRAAEARGVPGSGLGLAIVRQTAEAHGGSATVERPDGGGTRFALRLPVSERDLAGRLATRTR